MRLWLLALLMGVAGLPVQADVPQQGSGDERAAPAKEEKAEEPNKEEEKPESEEEKAVKRIKAAAKAGEGGPDGGDEPAADGAAAANSGNGEASPQQQAADTGGSAPAADAAPVEAPRVGADAAPASAPQLGSNEAMAASTPAAAAALTPEQNKAAEQAINAAAAPTLEQPQPDVGKAVEAAVKPEASKPSLAAGMLDGTPMAQQALGLTPAVDPMKATPENPAAFNSAAMLDPTPMRDQTPGLTPVDPEKAIAASFATPERMQDTQPEYTPAAVPAGMESTPVATRRETPDERLDTMQMVEKNDDKGWNTLNRELDANKFSKDSTLPSIDPENPMGGPRLTPQQLAQRTLSNRQYSLPNGNPLDGLTPNSRFGSRIDPFTGRAAFHAGEDIKAPPGTPIKATGAGVVAFAGCQQGGYGCHVLIDHGYNANGQRITTLYGHAQVGSIKVQEGQQVNAGDVIAGVGSTGRSTGPHLHYETRADGNPQNPRDYNVMMAQNTLSPQPVVAGAVQAGPVVASGAVGAAPGGGVVGAGTVAVGGNPVAAVAGNYNPATGGNISYNAGGYSGNVNLPSVGQMASGNFGGVNAGGFNFGSLMSGFGGAGGSSGGASSGGSGGYAAPAAANPYMAPVGGYSAANPYAMQAFNTGMPVQPNVSAQAMANMGISAGSCTSGWAMDCLTQSRVGTNTTAGGLWTCGGQTVTDANRALLQGQCVNPQRVG